MTISVCKGCGQKMMAIDRKTGRAACTTCIGLSPDSGIPVEVEVQTASVKCCYCGTPATGNDLAFYDSKSNTFYCGCRGWD